MWVFRLPQLLTATQALPPHAGVNGSDAFTLTLRLDHVHTFQACKKLDFFLVLKFILSENSFVAYSI